MNSSKRWDSVKKIIEEAETICSKYQNKRKAEGLDYNIFSMLGVERKELNTHENMMYLILNMGQERGMQVSFTNLFLKAMGLPNKFLSCEWNVEREHYIGAGRIDLFLESKDKEEQCVAVEIKIDADDQEAQLKRYDDFCKKHYKDYRLIYLTLDGKDAAEKSIKGVKDLKRILNRSFASHIVEWLEMCISACVANQIDASFIKQYEILVRKITNEEYMENEIKELIKGSDKIKACIAIANALEEVKYDIIYNFFEGLYNKVKRQCIDWDDWYITCRIRDVWVRNKKVSVGIRVEICDELSYCFVYCDENGELINSNNFKASNKQIANTIENVIAEVLKTKITQNQWSAIKIIKVKNSENKEYDFKHFDNVCAELGDEDIMRREVNYISGNVLKYIKDIGMALDEALGDRIVED